MRKKASPFGYGSSFLLEYLAGKAWNFRRKRGFSRHVVHTVGSCPIATYGNGCSNRVIYYDNSDCKANEFGELHNSALQFRVVLRPYERAEALPKPPQRPYH